MHQLAVASVGWMRIGAVAVVLVLEVARAGGTKTPTAITSQAEAVAATTNALLRLHSLLGTLETSQDETALAMAQSNLTILRGAGVEAALLGQMKLASPTVRCRLIEVIGQRLMTNALPALREQAARPEAGVRQAACQALAKLAGPRDLPALIELLIRQPAGSDGRAAEQMIVQVAQKIRREELRAQPVILALKKESRPAVQVALTHVLGGIGTPEALLALRSAARQDQPALRDAAVRELAGWPDSTALGILESLLQTDRDEARRGVVLRGFVRLLELPSDRPLEDTLQKYRQALDCARFSEDAKFVLARLGRLQDPAALPLIAPFLDSEIVVDTAQAILEIAEVAMKTPEKGRLKPILEKVLTNPPDESLRQRAEQLLLQIP